MEKQLKVAGCHESQQQEQIIIIPSEASIRARQNEALRSPSLDNDDKVVARWRERSHYVSYADLVVTFAAFVQGAVLVGLNIKDIFKARESAVKRTYLVIVLSLSLIQLGMYIKGFRMACQLYASTKPSIPQLEAIPLAKQWRKFHIFKIILALIIGLVTSKDFPSLASFNFLWFLVRVGFIYIVHKYIKAMEKNCNDESGELKPKSVASVGPVTTTDSHR